MREAVRVGAVERAAGARREWEHAFSVRYDLPRHGRSDLALVVAYLASRLPSVWASSYLEMAGSTSRLYTVDDAGVSFLFDVGAERVVAAYGRSHPAAGARDASRMRGFLGGRIVDEARGAMDKGHFFSHAQGGGLDINLFPQRSDVNRGWSWPRFRAMERYCAEHPGTFAFARPVYLDASWIPFAFDYGVLKSARELEHERFPN